jgi:3D (Asp-Asp-Asp) domain-containing protein
MFKIKKPLVTMMTVFTLALAGSMTAYAAESADTAEIETETDVDEGSSVILASGARSGKKKNVQKAAAAQNQTSDDAGNAVCEAKNNLSDTADDLSNADETSETSLTSDSDSTDHSGHTGLTSLGSFRTTAYCPCYACSEGYGRHTSTGTIAKSNHTIAVDPRVIPYGSKVMINGTVYTAEDRGGGVKGNHIDIFYDTHAQTRQYGSRNVEVFLLS